MEDTTEVQGVIKVSLMAVAYTEYDDIDKKDDIVKTGIRVGENTADFRSSLDVKDRGIWDNLIKDSYIRQFKDAYKEANQEGLDNLDEDMSRLTLFRDEDFPKEVSSAYERLSNTPVRLLMGRGDMNTSQDRLRFKQATDLFYGEDIEPNYGSKGVYNSPTVSIRDYKSILELEPITLEGMIDLKYLDESLGEEELNKLDNAIFNYIVGTIGDDNGLLNKDFINFKDEYESLLAQGLNVHLDIKLMAYDNENLVTVNDMVVPLVVLNDIVSEGLVRGVLDYTNLTVDDKGDILVKEFGDKRVKLKIYEMHESDTYIRMKYENDKRRKKYGKIQGIKSYSVGKGNTLIDSKDEYLKYINKI